MNIRPNFKYGLENAIMQFYTYFVLNTCSSLRFSLERRKIHFNNGIIDLHSFYCYNRF